MAEPILLDKNVLTSIARGNEPAAKALRAYLDSGTEVWIAHASARELLEQTPTPKMRGEYRELLKDLKIDRGPSGDYRDRMKLQEQNMDHVPGPNAPKLKDYARKEDTSRPGDSFVAAQAKATNARLWSFDKGMQRGAENLGVKLAPECRLGDKSGSEDVAVARRLLGLNPKAIDAEGNVVPPAKAGGPSGSFSPIEVQPSAKGQGRVAGALLFFALVNAVLDKLNSKNPKEKAQQALEAAKPAMLQDLGDSGENGLLARYYFRQPRGSDESLINPGATFEQLEWGVGATADEARRDAVRKPRLLAGGGENEQFVVSEVWYPPIKERPIAKLRVPFPPAALGTFALDSGGRAVFQTVSFSDLSGFDDEAEEKIQMPGGETGLFVILKPPTQIAWFNLNGRQTTKVALKDGRTFDGQILTCVDLDPWSPFNAKAVPIFPVDDFTSKIFALVNGVFDGGVLSINVNIGQCRWVRPQNLKVLTFM
jgi:predicted nucleic acid-binding protein